METEEGGGTTAATATTTAAAAARTDDPIAAISMNNVVKSYWQPCSSESKQKKVLQDVDFTVRKGTIYGLLGPSGCGKTTLLNCIVGQTKPNSGTILVFGYRTGTKKSGVPGLRVGYMPQDVALSRDLKVGETLSFYGVLLGMSSSQIKTKSQFLSQLLELPPNDRFIDTLSGGQQRRVSLAVTLFHDPELVILDEPTVGVDPIVRKRIWDHLFELATNNGQTILFTTHYIEEARMAHNVGMMSDGTIICEGPPDEVIQRHSCTSLENVFLKLCLERDSKQSEWVTKGNETVNSDKKSETNARGDLGFERKFTVSLSKSNDLHCNVMIDVDGIKKDINPADVPEHRIVFADEMASCFRLPKFSHLRALTVCNFRKIYRTFLDVFIHVFVACVLMTAFQLTYSRFPINIPIGVFNEDTDVLGATYLSHIDTKTLILKNFMTYEDGYRAVRTGDTWGLLHIHSNFSNSLVNRFVEGSRASNISINDGSIALALDFTCQPVSLTVIDTVTDAFMNFGKDMLESAGFESSLVSLPLTFQYDIFGRNKNGLMGFASPGIMLCGVFFLSMCTCLLSLLNDKASGQFSRNIVSGVTEVELLLSNVIAFSFGVLIQTVTYLIFTYGVLGLTCKGPLYLMFILVLLHGVCGVTFGLFVSTFCGSEFTSVMLGFGCVFPFLCLSGTIWPIQSIPQPIQNLCYLLPLTYSVDGLRAIVNRGWSITYPVVSYGIIANLAWIGIFFTLSAILLRLRNT